MQVVLDPGHGGTRVVGGSSPNNAVGPTGLLEKDVTLKIAILTRDVLISIGVSCQLTRTLDENLGLADRAHVARDANADAFVSIHLNGSDAHNAQGTETWIHPRATAATRSLASLVQGGALAATGYRDRGVKESAFGVLNPNYHAQGTAACLVEISFMDIAAEEQRLRTAAYKSRIAQALAQAIYGWLIASARVSVMGTSLKGYADQAFPEDGFEMLNGPREHDAIGASGGERLVPERGGEDLVIGEPAPEVDAKLVARLSFDGYKLRWHGSPNREWTAFSGVDDESARESVKDIGPTPQGHFTVDPADIQLLQPSADWGSHRVALQPLAATVQRMKDCFKLIRTGMYIHGGSVKGTKGCIEINDDNEELEFFNCLKDYGKPIDLDVKYTGGREKSYEESACPY